MIRHFIQTVAVCGTLFLAAAGVPDRLAAEAQVSSGALSALLDGALLDGTLGADGVTIDFPGTRDDFVSQTAAGLPVPDGTRVAVAGQVYVRVAGSSLIRDLPGWEPFGPASPEQFGAEANGRDDTEPLAAAFATGNVRLTPGRIYGFTELDVPPGAIVHNGDAILRYIGRETRRPVLTLGAGSQWDRLRYQAAAQTTGGEPSILIDGGVAIGTFELEADDQLDAGLVTVVGSGVDIGRMVSRGFGRPLTVSPASDGQMIDGFHLGWFDFESIVRGIRMDSVSNFSVDGGRQSGRSPLGRNEKPGRNNLLLGNLVHGRFGPMDLGDAPEHAIRFSSAGKALDTDGITFADLTIRRNSASAIKINPGKDARVRNVSFGEVTIIDPFHQIGKNAKASHLIRISHADNIRIKGGSVIRGSEFEGVDEDGTIFAIADSRGVDIGPFTVDCCAKTLVAFIENNDWDGPPPYGDIGDIDFAGIVTTGTGLPSGAPFRFETCGIDVDDIRIGGLDIRRSAGEKLFSFAKCNKGRAEGSIFLQGHVGELGDKSFAQVPKGFAISADLTDEDGWRLTGPLDSAARKLLKSR